MFRSGDIIENPITGERIIFRQTSAETDGEAVIVETLVQPGGYVAATHLHPHQEERFHVLNGNICIRAGKETLHAAPGDRVVVPAGIPHRFWNADSGEARFLCEVRPALHFEQLLGTMFALAADGKTNKKGMPNILRLAVIARACADTIQLPFPPAIVQRIGLGLAAPVGHLLGYRATYTPGRSTEQLGSWPATAHDLQ